MQVKKGPQNIAICKYYNLQILQFVNTAICKYYNLKNKILGHSIGDKFIHTSMTVSNLYNECLPVWDSDNGIYNEQE